WRAEDNDFLARFLDRHGDGPHHLTFKVDDLPAALERVEAAGITPVGVDMSSEIWREAFLQPRDAAGTVVQLASSSMPYKSPIEEYAAVRDGRFLGDDLESGEPWWGRPPPRAATPTYFRRVVMATPSIEDTSKLFVGLLDGTRAREGDGWLDLVWPGGGCIRVEEHSDRAAGVDR